MRCILFIEVGHKLMRKCLALVFIRESYIEPAVTDDECVRLP